jgi:ribulose-phosphate 3-epimerase
MEIIPGINCSDFKCVSEHWNEAAAFGARAVQIDVADGKFAPVKTWDDPSELAGLVKQNPGIVPEIHLMVEDPEDVFLEWLAAGAKKLVVHIESKGDLDLMERTVKTRGGEVIWGIKSGTPVEELYKRIGGKPGCLVQFLDVSPGFSDQKFNPKVADKIKFLRRERPDVKIRVDGGMNPETAKIAKKAGADGVVSVSYIFGSNDPAAAYQTLLGI